MAALLPAVAVAAQSTTSSGAHPLAAASNPNLNFARSPMGIPSFSAPLATPAFAPKVAKKTAKDLQREEEAAAAATAAATHAQAKSEMAQLATMHSMQRSASMSGGATPSSPRRGRSRERSLSRLGSLSSLHSGESDEGGSLSPRLRQRSLSPGKQAFGLSSVASMPMLDTSLLLLSAADRADHLAHAQLLERFSRILSAQELHALGERTPRVEAIAVPLTSQRGTTRSRARGGNTGGPVRSPKRATMDAALSGLPVSHAQLVANTHRQTVAASRQQSSSGASARGVPSHMRSVLSVRPTATSTAAAALRLMASKQQAPPEEPALDPAIASYLASLLGNSNAAPAAASAAAAPHQPSRPAAAQPAAGLLTSPRKQKVAHLL